MPVPACASSMLPSILVVPLLAAAVLAHGGKYVPPPPTPPPPTNGPPGGHYGGPGDTTPPGPSGPRTPGGPSGPSASSPTPASGGAGPSAAPAGPTTGGPGGPSAPPPGVGAAPGGPTTGGSLPLDVDATTWDYWWEFNKHLYLHRPTMDGAAVQTGSDDFYLGATRHVDARDAMRPTTDQIVRSVLPALKHALDSTANRDITSAAMVALAKIGQDHPDFRLVDVFAERLQRGDQEVRETAALALGIAAINDERTLELLGGLVLDAPVGRQACGSSVDARTRSFAAYGLGLAARQAVSVEVPARALAVLRQVVEDHVPSERNVKIAALHAIGLLDPGRRDYASTRLRTDAVGVLATYFAAPLGPGEQWVQAHCPTAIVRVAGRADGERIRQQFVDVLTETVRSQRRRHEIAQSCAQALGRLVAANDAPDDKDAPLSGMLLEVSRSHPDALTRNFALIALGQIGGALNRAALLREFDHGGKALRKPWCALALGVLERARQDALRSAGDAVAFDPLIASTLADELQVAKEPGLVGALAVALGLARATDAAAALRERLRDGPGRQRTTAYVCIGLALMQDRGAVEDIRAVMAAAMRRPELFVQAAVALGELGDRATAEFLLERMTDEQQNLPTLAACASALGHIGDRRSIEPLLRMLADTALGGLPRAFAAAALGGVCDRFDRPWNTALRVGVNWGANVETLTDQRAGVLDIL